MIEQTKKLEYYISLNYPITFYRDPEGGYVAEIEDLPGCLTEGDSLQEALQGIVNARRAWLGTALEDGLEIPLPRNEEQYSGKFITRLPKYLHRQLVERAKREGVSLNQYIETVLSQASIVSEFHSYIREIKAEFQEQNQFYRIEQATSLRNESFIASWTGAKSEERQLSKEKIRPETERIAA